jgi:hypothetical protein
MFLDKLDQAPVLNLHFTPMDFKQSPRISPTGAKIHLSFITNKLPKITMNSSPKNVSYLSLLHTPNNDKNQQKSLLLRNPSDKALLNFDEFSSKKVSKSQPRVSKNLPSVFINCLNKKVKFRKIPSKKNIDFSVDQALYSSDKRMELPMENAPLSARQEYNQPHKSFPSPVKLLSTPQTDKRPSGGTPKEQDSIIERKMFTRQEKIDADGHKVKKLIIFKKYKSRSPETDQANVQQQPLVEPIKSMPTVQQPYNQNKRDLINFKMFDMLEKIPKIQLSQFITLKKIRTTINHGIVKRMLHVPTFRIYDILEEPLAELKSRENNMLRDWTNIWKSNFDSNRNLLRIYTCFWNSPEGSLSILVESAKKNFLAEMLGTMITLPENCIQSIAVDVLTGLNDVHKKLKAPHGFVNSSEIGFDSQYKAKLGPAVSFRMNSQFKVSTPLVKRGEIEPLKYHHINDHRPSLGHAEGPAKFSDMNTAFSMPQDIFDFGLLLLICALGPLEYYDTTNFFTPETLHQLIDLVPSKKLTKGVCCLIHSEEHLRKVIAGAQLSCPSSAQLPKTPLNNNFQSPKSKDCPKINHNNPNDNNTRTNEFNILWHLKNRFSESFIDFLCSCLKIDPDHRVNCDLLLAHEFLSENHHSLGPTVNIKELLQMGNVNQLNTKEITNTMSHQQLDKFCEAMRLVFMNKEIKENFYEMLNRTPTKTIEDKKLSDLAVELDVPASIIWDRIQNNVLNVTPQKDKRMKSPSNLSNILNSLHNSSFSNYNNIVKPARRGDSVEKQRGFR